MSDVLTNPDLIAFVILLITNAGTLVQAWKKTQEASTATAELTQTVNFFDPQNPEMTPPKTVPVRSYRSEPDMIDFMMAGHPEAVKLEIARQITQNESQGVYDYWVLTPTHHYHVSYGGIIGCRSYGK